MISSATVRDAAGALLASNLQGRILKFFSGGVTQILNFYIGRNE